MNKTKNKIPFIHVTALKILREERDLLAEDLRTIKSQIAHLSQVAAKEPDDYEYYRWEVIYGGSVPKLMKLQRKWNKEVKDVEEAIRVLKLDAQQHHQDKWDEQQYIEEVTSGSYNCLYGC